MVVTDNGEELAKLGDREDSKNPIMVVTDNGEELAKQEATVYVSELINWTYS